MRSTSTFANDEEEGNNHLDTRENRPRISTKGKLVYVLDLRKLIRKLITEVTDICIGTCYSRKVQSAESVNQFINPVAALNSVNFSLY